jgi:hypothetical protein
MRKLLRVGLLVASLSGLVATLAPTPADAQTAGAIGFVGTATVGHGIAYPLINNSAPPPPLHLSTSKAAPFIHNSAVIEKFETIVPGCLGAVASTKSPTLAKVVPSVCAIGPQTAGNTGTVHGYCGLSDGTVRVIVSAGGFSYTVNVSFVAVGGQLVLSGHWHKHGTTHSGPLLGTANASPDTLGIAGQGTGSCLGKQRKTFIVVGAAVFGGGSGTSLPHISLPKASSPVTASVSVG